LRPRFLRLCGHIDVGAVFLRWQGGRCRCQRLRFVQEQVALPGIALLTLRAEQPAYHDLQLFLDEIALNLRHTQLAAQFIAFAAQRVTFVARSNERIEFFDANRETFAGHASTIANRLTQWVYVLL
jgi:hypothetical protein